MYKLFLMKTTVYLKYFKNKAYNIFSPINICCVFSEHDAQIFTLIINTVIFAEIEFKTYIILLQ